jgi:hypothetical protein
MARKKLKAKTAQVRLKKEEHGVEEILKKRINKNGKIEYFLKWTGFNK